MTVALAICGAVLLVVSVVYDGLVAAMIAALAGGLLLLWYVVPHLGRRDTDY